MNDLSLIEPAAGLRDEARAAWTREATAMPAVGEIWLLSWNTVAHGLVLVTAVLPDHVLGMPVLMGTEYATGGELVLPADILGTELTLLHEAETGLGKFLFHRNLGHAVSADDTVGLRTGRHDGLLAGSHPLTDEIEASLSATLHTFQALCFIEWPALTVGESILNRSVLEGLGVNARAFAHASGLDVPSALRTWRGQEPMTERAQSRLAAAYELSPAEVLLAPDDEETRFLSSPQFKSGVVELAVNLAITEGAARNAVRADFALAARTDSFSARKRTLVADTLARLVESSRATP